MAGSEAKSEIIRRYKRNIRRQRACGLLGMLGLAGIIALAIIRNRLEMSPSSPVFVAGLAAMVAVIALAVVGNFVFYRCPSCRAYLGLNRGRKVFDVDVAGCTRCGTAFE